MTTIRNFFRIYSKYKFEWNDLRAGITLLNVILIMIFGLSISWFGLAIAIFGIVKELTGNRRINCLLMYLANFALNVHFLLMYFSN